ncbi:MAG TPA: hypothetical protein VNE22_03510 [Acidimicrobiales bacterium]|nr:hypothetical protein [Acidimicrobiales bacterium]
MARRLSWHESPAATWICVATAKLRVAQVSVARSPALATSVQVAGPLRGRTTGSSPGRSQPDSASVFAFAATAVAKLAPFEAVDGEDATTELARGTLVDGLVGLGRRGETLVVVTLVEVTLVVTGGARLVVERLTVVGVNGAARVMGWVLRVKTRISSSSGLDQITHRVLRKESNNLAIVCEG